MAKKHPEPSHDVGTGNEKLTKHASTAREELIGVSPARPNVREWASASYDATTGRPNIFC